MLLQDEGQDDVINRAVHPGAQNAPRCVSAPKSARLDMRTEDPVKTTTLVKPGMKGELLIARVRPLTPGDSASKVMASWAMPPPVPSPPTCLPPAQISHSSLSQCPVCQRDTRLLPRARRTLTIMGVSSESEPGMLTHQSQGAV